MALLLMLEWPFVCRFLNIDMVNIGGGESSTTTEAQNVDVANMNPQPREPLHVQHV